jgi:hypothetical protein
LKNPPQRGYFGAIVSIVASRAALEVAHAAGELGYVAQLVRI